MKSTFTTILPLASLLVAPALAQWLPSCSWNDCMNGWDGSTCDKQSGWDCICSNSTAIAQINTCVATSCTNTTDQEAIYGAIAQLCVNNGVAVTNSQQATFSATSGGSLYPTITGRPGWGPNGNYGSAAWSSWVSAASTAIGSAPSGWGSGSPWGSGWHGGHGGPGSGSGSGTFGPWGTKASGIDCSHWTTWTAGWGPFSSWTGTWSGCSSTTKTPIPATVTTTFTTSGVTSVVTGTTFGIQQAAAASTSGSGAASTHAHISSSRTFGLCGAVAAAVFALMVAL